MRDSEKADQWVVQKDWTLAATTAEKKADQKGGMSVGDSVD
jgi:hypothetical protein